MTEINSDQSAQITNDGSKPDGGGITQTPGGGSVIANPDNGVIRNPDGGIIIINPGDGISEEGPIRPIQDKVAEKYLTTILHSQKLIAKLLTKRPTGKRAFIIQKFMDKVKRPDTKILSEEFLAKKYGSKAEVQRITEEFQTQTQQHELELEQFKSRIRGKDTELTTK